MNATMMTNQPNNRQARLAGFHSLKRACGRDLLTRKSIAIESVLADYDHRPVTNCLRNRMR